MQVNNMTNNTAGWKALREPKTFRGAAKLLGVTVADVELMVRRLDLFTIEVRGKVLIPTCELARFSPLR